MNWKVGLHQIATILVPLPWTSSLHNCEEYISQSNILLQLNTEIGPESQYCRIPGPQEHCLEGPELRIELVTQQQEQLFLLLLLFLLPALVLSPCSLAFFWFVLCSEILHLVLPRTLKSHASSQALISLDGIFNVFTSQDLQNYSFPSLDLHQ